MLLSVAVLLLATGPTIEARPEPTWPKKGDTVYISATLTGTQGGVSAFGWASGPTAYNAPACVPMIIKKAYPWKNEWITRDPAGSGQLLRGPWMPWMHHTETECNAHLAAEGEPRIVRSGVIQQIVPSSE